MEILHKVAILGGKSVDYPLSADVTFKKAQRVRYEPSGKQQDLPMMEFERRQNSKLRSRV